MRRTAAVTLTVMSVLVAGGLLAGGHADAATAGACVPGAVYGNPLPVAATTATKIRDGFSFLEGPTWDAASGTLLMSDMQSASGPERVQGASIVRFTPPSTVQTFIAGSGSNGLAVSADGTAVLAASQDRREISSYRLADSTRTTVAAGYQGRKFNSPNDLTIRGDGTVYFTDPNFQRGNRADEQGGRTSVFRVTNGVVSLVDNSIRQPNGIALAPDGNTLYVGGNGDNAIFAYPVRADGSVGARTRFATLAGPDGVTVDCAGNVYWASYNDGKVHVFSPAGRKLGTISAGRNTTNAAFGGADRRTLFITSGSQASGGTPGNFGLYSIRLNVPGMPY